MAKILETFHVNKLLIKEYNNWYLVLRKDQVTLGSLVLIEKNFEKEYSSLPSKSFQELEVIVKDLELVLKNLFQYDKINYLMLMMVDPEVHYHIIPRYSRIKEWNSLKFHDFGWPKTPNLNCFNDLSEKDIIKLKKFIKNNFL
jgi:diadenosine tetraphosphate (Ap4A) HIT family hydrolase